MKTAESHNAELTGRIEILPMPPIPEWFLKWIEGQYKAAEATSAQTELLPAVHIKGNTPSA